MERPARTWKQTPPESEPGPSPASDVKAGDVLDGRLYLRVSYKEKDEFKRVVRAAGIRPGWCEEKKLWHVDATVSRHLIQRWLPSSG
ncbi:DUF5710 domain-containing protein [Planomonospora algeriensis]